MSTADEDSFRRNIEAGLKASGRKFLGPSTWEWFFRAREEGLRRRAAGRRPDFDTSELHLMLPRYDGSERMRSVSSCNRWIAHCANAEVMVRVLGKVRVRTHIEGWSFDKLSIAENPAETRRKIAQQETRLIHTYCSLERYHGGKNRSWVEALEWTWRFLHGPGI